MKFIKLDEKFVNQKLSDEFRRVVIDGWNKETLDESFFVGLVRHVVGDPKSYPPYSVGLLKTIIDLTKVASESGVENGYHNPMHTAEVTMMTAYFAKQAGIEGEDYLRLIISSLGHDLNHPGHGNPKEDIAFNERNSANDVADIMSKNGCDAHSIDIVSAFIVSTSPNGPHAYVKNNCQGDGWDMMQGVLHAQSPYLEMAKILCDADVFSSAGVDKTIIKQYSLKLNQEARAIGSDLVFDTPEANMYFLDNIVGKDGFSSKIAGELANDNFHAIRNATLKSIPS